MTRAPSRIMVAITMVVLIAGLGVPRARATYRTEPTTLALGLWRPMSLPYPDEGDSDLWLVASDGVPVRRLTNTPHRDEEHPRWSPTGETIAFAAGTDDACEIYTVGADGSEIRRLTRSGAVDAEPSWSPEGGRIAWIRTVADTSIDEVWIMRADGSDPQRVPVDLPGSALESPLWSPDGESMAVSVYLEEDHQFDLFRFRVDGAGVQRLTQTPRSEVLLDWSPNGRRLLVSRARTPYIQDDPDALITLHVDGTDARRIVPNAHPLDARYAPDGRFVYLTEPRAGGWTHLARAQLSADAADTVLSFEGHVITSTLSCF